MSPRRSATATELRAEAALFAALGDRTRLRIVTRLSVDGPSSIASLTTGAGVTRQAVTKHLRVLSDAGLIRDERVGRERVFELEPRRLDAARRAIDRLSAQWDSALDSLARLVEDE